MSSPWAAWLGIGAAWFEREHHGLGIPFPPLKTRFEMLEETIQVCHQMWSDNDGPFDGKHFHLAETLCSPKPVQKPRPPILVAGAANGRRCDWSHATATPATSAGPMSRAQSA